MIDLPLPQQKLLATYNILASIVVAILLLVIGTLVVHKPHCIQQACTAPTSSYTCQAIKPLQTLLNTYSNTGFVHLTSALVGRLL